MCDNEIKTEEQLSNDIEQKRWKNRRRMAWLSLMSIIVITLLILLTDLVSIERLKVLSEVITWFYFCCASVIGAYMGFTTWANMKGKQ